MKVPNLRIVWLKAAWTASILFALLTTGFLVGGLTGFVEAGVCKPRFGCIEAWAVDTHFIIHIASLAQAPPTIDFGLPLSQARPHAESVSPWFNYRRGGSLGYTEPLWGNSLHHQKIWAFPASVVLSSRSLNVPTWFILVLGLLPLAVLAASKFHRRRIPPGHCRKCRYDLTGNTSGICPECGTPIRPV